MLLTLFILLSDILLTEFGSDSMADWQTLWPCSDTCSEMFAHHRNSDVCVSVFVSGGRLSPHVDCADDLGEGRRDGAAG